MKELSIEQKAKAYDEAIKRIQSYVVDEYGCTRIKVVNVFPELKESEDENIIKHDIIEFIKRNKSPFAPVPSDITLDKWIAWLEKQGEKSQGKSIKEAWKVMRLEVYAQASGNRHEPNYSDDSTKMFSLNDIDEIIEKINEND